MILWAVDIDIGGGVGGVCVETDDDRMCVYMCLKLFFLAATTRQLELFLRLFKCENNRRCK